MLGSRVLQEGLVSVTERADGTDGRAVTNRIKEHSK